MGFVKDRDVLSGSALAGLGVFILVNALQWNYIGPDGPGPGFFPLWYGIAMIALSLYLVVKSAVKPDPDARSPLDWRGVGRALSTWAAFALCVALMEPLGFPVSFGLLAFFMVSPVMGKSVLAALLTAVGLSTGFWALFSLALGINLPMGTVWAPLGSALGIS